MMTLLLYWAVTTVITLALIAICLEEITIFDLFLSISTGWVGAWIPLASLVLSEKPRYRIPTVIWRKKP